MRRWIIPSIAAAFVIAALLAQWLPSVLGASDATFPPPTENQAVYDPAGALTAEDEALLEQQIDAIEQRSGAETAIYVRIDRSVNDDSNLADARRLMDEWGVGRRGYDDGLVIMLTFEDASFQHGVVSTYAGSGFLGAYLGRDAQQAVREQAIIPAIREGNPGAGLIAAMVLVDAAVTPSATDKLNLLRAINAWIGIPGGIMVLLLSVGAGYLTWRRYGDDPELVDSESVLMAGPPAGMTPPLATVVRDGKATQHSVNTILVELAGAGYIAFRNLDQVRKRKSDDDPDPLLDPAIDVKQQPPPDAPRLAKAEAVAWETIRQNAVGGELTRERLWDLNGDLSGVKKRLDEDAVRQGWLARLPSPLITKWVAIGIGELVVAGLCLFGGYAIPMSGLTLVGIALAIGGLVTVVLGNAMSQRTSQGAYVDAMLKAYRRTLKKTMELSRSVEQAVTDDAVAVLADTPDKLVVWGFALGLQKEVAALVERGLAEARQTGAPAYYPVWMGSTGSSSSSGLMGAGAGGGLGGLFSGSGTPDIGGMFSAMGSVGSSPPSSSSGGGGFGGGGGGGGGGGSSGF
ncbi:MAG TPA: TPM domain-containing protein [Candidatus Limnocylindria bacterium]